MRTQNKHALVSFALALIAGCHAGRLQHDAARSQVFVGKDYQSYQTNGYRLYIPGPIDFFPECHPMRQIDYLCSLGILAPDSFYRATNYHLPDFSVDTVLNTNQDTYESDWIAFNGPIVAIEMVQAVSDGEDHATRTYTLLIDFTGYTPGPVDVFEVTIHSTSKDTSCYGFLKAAKLDRIVWKHIMM